jgi:signal recognition particle receptor subunit beta
MVQFNLALREINCKVVYFGPGLSGKTTNLEVVHQKAPEESRGVLSSIATESDRTLFFDFMPLNLGTVGGMKTKFQLYTVPGQVYYNSTRKLVLRGADGVVFVADSNPEKMAENLESLQNLSDCLREQGRSLADVAHVIQLNKRDLPNAMSIEEMGAALNRYGAPLVEACAAKGTGVVETFKALSVVVLQKVKAMAEERAGAPARPGPAGSPTPVAPAPSASAPTPLSAQAPSRPAADPRGGAAVAEARPNAAARAAVAPPPRSAAPAAPPRPAPAAPPVPRPDDSAVPKRLPQSTSNERKMVSTTGPRGPAPWKIWAGAALVGGLVAGLVLVLFK